MSKYIFELNRKDYSYKGVLFAELDNNSFYKEYGLSLPKSYVAGLMGLIWTDENGIWHMKFRIKFPNGNKQSFSQEYSKDANETLVLQDIYKLPLVNKNWYPNKDGSIDGILDVIKKTDMIEHSITSDGTNTEVFVSTT